MKYRVILTMLLMVVLFGVLALFDVGEQPQQQTYTPSSSGSDDAAMKSFKIN